MEITEIRSGGCFGQTLQTRFGLYEHGQLSLRLIDRDGEPRVTATCPVVERLAAGCVAVKVWAENEGLDLVLRSFQDRIKPFKLRSVNHSTSGSDFSSRFLQNQPEDDNERRSQIGTSFHCQKLRYSLWCRPRLNCGAGDLIEGANLTQNL